MFRSRLVLVLAALASLAGCATSSKAGRVAPHASSEPVHKAHAAQSSKPALRTPEPPLKPDEPPPKPDEPPAVPTVTASEFFCSEKGTLERRPPTERPAGVVAYEPGMTRPEKLSGPAPMYTPEALEAGTQGQFITRCILSREGLVRSCRVLKPLPPMEEAVLSALCASRYSPVLREGQPVDAEYTFNVRLSPP